MFESADHLHVFHHTFG